LPETYSVHDDDDEGGELSGPRYAR